MPEFKKGFPLVFRQLLPRIPGETGAHLLKIHPNKLKKQAEAGIRRAWKIVLESHRQFPYTDDETQA